MFEEMYSCTSVPFPICRAGAQLLIHLFKENIQKEKVKGKDPSAEMGVILSPFGAGEKKEVTN